MRVDGLSAPALGVSDRPRLSFAAKGTAATEALTAARAVVVDSSGGTVWDSGWVSTGQWRHCGVSGARKKKGMRERERRSKGRKREAEERDEHSKRNTETYTAQ